jgi:predicted porin
MWIASIEYAAHDVLLAAEYSQWDASVTVTPALAPVITATNERFYVMASFRAASWFSPGVYYSYLAPDKADRSGVDGELHDVAVTARYDINDHWLVKLEGHYMHGTADLNTQLNNGTPAAELAPDWGLFLIKTTAYF